MNFTIYLLNIKYQKFYIEAIKEYEKRLSRYCKLKTVKAKTYEEIKTKISESTYIISVNPKGKTISSEEWAEKISQYGVRGISNIALVIGDIPCDEAIALSKMDMEEGLVNTALLEQIYRAYRILGNEPYHK